MLLLLLTKKVLSNSIATCICNICLFLLHAAGVGSPKTKRAGEVGKKENGSTSALLKRSSSRQPTAAAAAAAAAAVVSKQPTATATAAGVSKQPTAAAAAAAVVNKVKHDEGQSLLWCYNMN